MLVIVVVFVVMSAWPGPPALLALPGLALWLVEALALAVLLGALCARFRDIPPIVASVMQMAFFVTPVIWKPELMREHQWMLKFNPFYSLLEIVRGPLQSEIPDATIYASALVSSVLLCVAAWIMFA